MAQIINMPRLSDTMEEGVVAKWLVNIGDEVKEGDILAEIETDKATMEFESFYEGTLLHIGINEGQTAAWKSLKYFHRLFCFRWYRFRIKIS